MPAGVFTAEWLMWLRDVIDEYGPGDDWELHEIIYLLEKTGRSPYRHTWRIIGGRPRSPEIDAGLGVLAVEGYPVPRRDIGGGRGVLLRRLG